VPPEIEWASCWAPGASQNPDSRTAGSINIAMQTIVIATGGFDPVHSGHIQYLDAARALGDRLIVGVNSDAWLERKKARSFMPWAERSAIVGSLRMVDSVIAFDDSDGTALDAIAQVRQQYPRDRILFVNGGDRGRGNSPENPTTAPGVEFVWGVGGDNKANSSSWILEEWKAPRTERPWGYYRVLHEYPPNIRLKELTVDPGQRLSMQRHSQRNEFWFVAQGTATVYTLDISTDFELVGEFGPHQHIWIDDRQWHQLCNQGSEPLRIIEIQYGPDCREDDIQRF